MTNCSLQPTSNESPSYPTLFPIHPRNTLQNLSIDMNAMSIQAMLATSGMDIDAPAANASNTFFSVLEQIEKSQKILNGIIFVEDIC